MATPKSPEPLTRRRAREQKTSLDPLALADSRVQRMRERRDRSSERRFSALFFVAVSLITLYLLSRTPWGIHLIARYF